MQDPLTEARHLASHGRLADAARVCETILAREHDNLGALVQLGEIQQQLGQYADSVKLLSRAASMDARCAGVRIALAAAHCALRQFAEAESCARAALALEPANHLALCQLGLAVGGLARREEAAGFLAQAVAARGDFAEGWTYLGLMLMEMGRNEEAASALQRAVELSPTRDMAVVALGRLLVQQDKPGEALPLLERGVVLRPEIAEFRRNLGNALHGLGRLAEARAAYVAALGLDPNMSAAAANLAMVLEQQGQLDEALRWMQRALELDGDNAVYLQQMAKLHERRRDPLTAAGYWDKLAALAPRSARGHVVVGQALEKKGRADEAMEHYRTALRLHGDLAEAYDRLARLHKELGDINESESALRESIRLRPQATGPYAALGLLLGGKLPEADFSMLESRACDPRVDDESRSHLLFALVHVLDSRGAYEQAAHYSRQANALAFDSRRPPGPRSAATRHERFVDGVIAAFDGRFFERIRGAGLTTTRPVFVFGLPRSGTSLVEQILASHPQIHGAGELFLAPQTFEAIGSVVGRGGSPLDGVGKLDAGSISRLASMYLDGLGALDQGHSPRIVDKSPQNYQLLGFLAALFPQATFIHCRRNLQDVALSCWLTEFDLVDWAQDQEQIAARFGQYLRLMRHWRSVLKVKIHDIEYERTVSDLEGVARGLVAACRLEWNPVCLDFHRHRRAVRTASATQVRQPIYTRSIGRWKHYEPYLGDLFARLPIE